MDRGFTRRIISKIRRLHLRLERITLSYLLERKHGVVACNICGWSGVRFVSNQWSKYAICPGCSSGVRHRLLFAALQYLPEFAYADLLKNKKILHFAPKPALKKQLERSAAIYDTADYYRQKMNLQLNIADMKEVPDQSYDILIACDVLEHVLNDKLALAEIYRVLVPGGYAILTVPQKDGLEITIEGNDVTDSKEREKQFGFQDHFRMYGKDFKKILERVGFQVYVVDRNSFDTSVVIRHVLHPPVLTSHSLATNYRRIYFARKPYDKN